MAIRSTFGRLTKSFGEPFKEPPSDDDRVWVGKVDYVDFAKADPKGGLISLFVLKRLSFQHECEVRAIVARFQDFNYPASLEAPVATWW